jgi:hypothetical protein
MQQLQAKSGSGVVTIPKAKLRQDDLLDDGDIPDQQSVAVDRIGRRSYVVRFPEDGYLPDLSECESIRRVAAELALANSQNQRGHPADQNAASSRFSGW